MEDIDDNTLNNLIKLSRIDCDEAEKTALFNNLRAFLKHIDHIKTIDTDGIDPCEYVNQQITPKQRKDENTEHLERETFLKNSPSHIGGMIKVPPVIDF